MFQNITCRTLQVTIIISDSAARFIPVKPIIFRTQAESLYQEKVTNDSGYVVFSFNNWQDKISVSPDNIIRMALDFPNTDKVIRADGRITFEHLIYTDVDFRSNPDKIEIILPMTVTKDEFIIGNTNWLNVCNFAVMNDMHVGEDFDDFGTSGWNDDTIAGQTNLKIQNNENIVAAINNLNPDFIVVLGDVTGSSERSKYKCARKILGQLLQKPYIPVIGNHDMWPYTDNGEVNIPADCYKGEYFYDGVDLAGIPHILWEGDSMNMRYYTIVDTNITTQIFDENVDFPFIGMNGDLIQIFYTARDSIRYRYSWTGTTNLSQILTVASCESPISSGQYLAWTKRDDGLFHLYYGAIPASGWIKPVEINYSTDLIGYPQILFNPAKQNQSAAIDLVWTEYSEIDSIGYICYLNLPLTDVAPKYAFDMGQETLVPILVQRDGFKVLGTEDYKTFDYDSTELVYHLTLHSPHTKYRIRWAWYHEGQNKIKLQFNIDNKFHRNRWVNPNEKVIEEGWIPDACVHDNEITIKVKVLNGLIAVLSGFEIYTEEVGGGPQGSEAQLTKPFYFDKIYPNPAKGILRIGFSSPDNRKVSINSMMSVAGLCTNKI